jgi:hypothetical protein
LPLPDDAQEASYFAAADNRAIFSLSSIQILYTSIGNNAIAAKGKKSRIR